MAKKKKAVMGLIEKPVIPEETTNVPVEEQEVLTDELKVGLERELRRYIKKGDPKKPDEPGGFRKGLPKEDEKKAWKIMKRLGRKELKWDVTILVPGFETPEA